MLHYYFSTDHIPSNRENRAGRSILQRIRWCREKKSWVVAEPGEDASSFPEHCRLRHEADTIRQISIVSSGYTVSTGEDFSFEHHCFLLPQREFLLRREVKGNQTLYSIVEGRDTSDSILLFVEALGVIVPARTTGEVLHGCVYQGPSLSNRYPVQTSCAVLLEKGDVISFTSWTCARESKRKDDRPPGSLILSNQGDGVIEGTATRPTAKGTFVRKLEISAPSIF